MNALRTPLLASLRPLRCLPSSSSRSLTTYPSAFSPTPHRLAPFNSSRGPRREPWQEEQKQGFDNPEEADGTIIPPKKRPASSSFYTGRSAYYDQYNHLINAANASRRALTALQLYPLPHFARKSLPPRTPAWKKREDMALVFERNLSITEYARVLKKLNQIQEYKRIADVACIDDLSEMIQALLDLFERTDKTVFLSRGTRSATLVDQYGRTYTVGKRKTSSARIWIIPVKNAFPEALTKESQSELEPDVQQTAETVVEGVHTGPEPTPVDQVLDALEDSAGPISLLQPKATEIQTSVDDATRNNPLFTPDFELKDTPVTVTTSAILVNNLPLATYFPLPADRERVVRPLKMAGVLGAYNVFCLVRGGGTTGQSGAIMQGIAKGLVRHEPKVASLLRRSKLTFRDPRMVERKKTGRAKARKGYAWVRR